MSNPLAFARDRRRNEDGFTLIELLVVVVILGILIGIAIPVYLNYRKSANDKAAQSDVRSAVSTLEVCNSDTGYPTAVPAAGGSLSAGGCTQTIPISDNTVLKYVPTPATGTVTSYILFGANTGGSANKVYCYNSALGGAVKTATGATFTAPGTFGGTATCL